MTLRASQLETLSRIERFALEELKRRYSGIVVGGGTEVVQGTLYVNGRVAKSLRNKGLACHRGGAGYNQRIGLTQQGHQALSEGGGE